MLMRIDPGCPFCLDGRTVQEIVPRGERGTRSFLRVTLIFFRVDMANLKSTLLSENALFYEN